MSEPEIVERSVQGMRIACPAGWSDKSMLILNADTPGATGVTPNVVVTRDASVDDLPVERPARLEAYVERQLADMATVLSGFVIVSRLHATADRWSAELVIEWLADGTPLMQRISYAVADDDAVIVATATTGRADFATLEAELQAILHTVRLR